MKPEEQFGEDARYAHGRRTWCRACYGVYNEQRRTLTLKQTRRSKLGISIEDQDAMWQRQEGRCAACEYEFVDEHDAHLDHDHATGEVRAFLCAACNHIVGRSGESADHLLAVVEYLRGMES